MLNWSKLGAIGNSSTAKLTIFAPLIGTFILYNENMRLAFTPGVPNPSPTRIFEVASKVHAHSVEFLYFGLILMGVATFVFQAMSPRQFKIALTPDGYAARKVEQVAKAPLREDLNELVRAVAKEDGNSLELAQGKVLIESIFQSVDFTLPENRSILTDLGRSLSENGRPSGRLIAISAATENLLLFGALVESCRDSSFDVHYCNYKIQDKSGSHARFITSLLMGISILLLLAPTMATAAIILGGLL